MTASTSVSLFNETQLVYRTLQRVISREHYCRTNKAISPMQHMSRHAAGHPAVAGDFRQQVVLHHQLGHYVYSLAIYSWSEAMAKFSTPTRPEQIS